MQITVMKAGNVLRLLSASESIPEGRPLKFVSLPEDQASRTGDTKRDETQVISRPGPAAGPEIPDDAHVNWEDYFEIQ
jgi:hypothetical protein